MAIAMHASHRRVRPKLQQVVFTTVAGGSTPRTPAHPLCRAAKRVGREMAPRAAARRAGSHDGPRELGMEQKRLGQHAAKPSCLLPGRSEGPQKANPVELAL